MSRKAKWTGLIPRLGLLAALLVVRLPSLQAQVPDSAGVSAALRSRIEQMRENGSLQVGDEVVPSHALTLAVYERRGFQPLWTDDGASASLLLGIADLRDDGLDPESYHLSALRGADQMPLDAARKAELDILRTDALVHAGHDLRYGKTEPAWPLGVREREGAEGDADAVMDLFGVVTSAKVHEAFADLRPRRVAYATLRNALADLRAIQASGGWGTIPSGPPMGRGDSDDRVAMLRRRLALEDHLHEPADETNRFYDSALEEVVRR